MIIVKEAKNAEIILINKTPEIDSNGRYV